MKEHGEELMHVDLIIVEDTQNEHEHIMRKSHRKNEEHAEVKRQEDAEMEDHMEGEHVEREKQENQKEGAETEDVDSADEDVGDDHSDTFVDDLSNEQTSISDNEDDANNEVPLADAEIEELVDEFLEVESKAAEAQESLEKEALAQVNNEVRAELAESLHGDALEMAVLSEMKTFEENWEAVLDDLETQSSLLLEQLDGAGIDLSNLYKWIESQAPNGCCTEAWKKRAHWVGCQVSSELSESVRNAEAYLQSCRPVRRQHGKLLEEGASGYLARKLSAEDRNSLTENSEKDWSSFNQLIQPRNCTESGSFGSENWASVYLASTPHQAARLGLKLPGVDEVEEIGEIEYDTGDPFYADAIANEKEIDLSEEQKRNFRKVREEDDAKITRKLQGYLKKKRQGKRKCPEPIEKEASSGRVLPNECSHPAFEGSNFEIGEVNCDIRENSAQELKSHMINNECKIEDSAADTLKRSHDNNDMKVDNKRCRTVIIDSDDEVQVLENNSVSNKQSRYQGSPSQIEKVIDIIDVDILPSPFSKSFCSEDNNSEIYCTACSRVLEISEVNKHPHLEVIVCESCKNLLQEKNRFEDPCLGTYCVWCGNSIDLIQCNFCKLRFCGICLTRNFGKERSSEAKTSGWQCCCCLPILLHQLILECEKVVGGRQASGSETDSEVSEAEKDAPISNKRRKKKRIRRILDDAELGEETKKIIAIEKARQEHLKTMQVQASRKSWSKYITKLNGISEGDANVAILGDAKDGYIVNVAKEEDEEPVRIPPSISAKLKPHQVAGIRFMWENVIQSVKKVQSGDKGLGCILAHTMGLGKTFQVIAFLYTALRGVNLGLRTALVVTPVNVLHNWRYEFDKWRPLEYKPLRVLMLEDVVRERRAHLLAKWRTKGGVLLIGYAAFRNLSLGRHQKDRESANEICRALQYGPDILVCDEAHMIKNTKAETTHALKQVQTQRRIALTGSPLQNNLMEYYCMVDFVREGFLGSSHEFRNRFQNPIENGQHTNSTSQDVKIMNQRSHILYEQLKGFVQRMDMNVVKKDLPPKTVFVITVKLSPLQKKLYKRYLDVHGFTSDKAACEKTNKQSSFFACYQVLAQIWNHPGLLQMTKEHKDHLKREDAVENFLVDDSASDDNLEYNELLNREKQRTRSDLLPKKSDDISSREEIDWWEDLFSEKLYKQVDYSGKMVLVLDILAMSSEAGDKALVFSQSLTTLNLIEKFLSKLPRKGKEGKYWKQGKDWYRLDGRTDGLERQKLVDKFNEKLNTRVKCTLISTRAGSLGINLHAANRVIIFDGSWNPTYDLQAIYRAWRYGQSKPVYAYRLMAHGTMEEKIYKRQVTKEGLAARVVDRQQIHRTMSKEDIRYLFDFGDEENTDTAEQGQDQLVLYNQDTTADIARLTEQKYLHHGSISSDKIMKSLLSRHSCWIANYHEHETLLQENEEERLSKEEQDMAWQTYQRSLEWQEVRKVAIDDHEMKPVQNIVAPEKVTSENIISQQTTSSSRSHPVHPRKCSNLAHLLTLRSQNIKAGCITNCSECLQEISWESLNRDGKSK